MQKMVSYIYRHVVRDTGLSWLCTYLFFSWNANYAIELSHLTRLYKITNTTQMLLWAFFLCSYIGPNVWPSVEAGKT